MKVRLPIAVANLDQTIAIQESITQECPKWTCAVLQCIAITRHTPNTKSQCTELRIPTTYGLIETYNVRLSQLQESKRDTFKGAQTSS